MTHISRWPGLQAGAELKQTEHRRTPRPWRCREAELIWIPPVMNDLFLLEPHPGYVGEETGLSACLGTLLPTISAAAVPAVLARTTRQWWLAFIANRLAATISGNLNAESPADFGARKDTSADGHDQGKE